MSRPGLPQCPRSWPGSQSRVTATNGPSIFDVGVFLGTGTRLSPLLLSYSPDGLYHYYPSRSAPHGGVHLTIPGLCILALPGEQYNMQVPGGILLGGTPPLGNTRDGFSAARARAASPERVVFCASLFSNKVTYQIQIC